MSKTIKPLTNEQLRAKAPSLFQDQPYHEVSSKYHFIGTIDIIEQLRNESWFPVSVSQAGVRDLSKDGFQQHYVRFQYFSDLINPNANVVELLLFNSHDRSMSFSISAGVYRYICSNGLIIADSVFDSYKIKHLGERNNDVLNAVANITAIKPRLLEKISKFESITLNQNEKESFLQSALPLRFEKHLKLDNPTELLTPLRDEDRKDDLYTVLNILQENFLSSKVSGYNKESKRRFTSKQITSISKDVEINKGLWEIAERIASIKDSSYDSIAA
jgi:hypothetical protein